ncbi:carboxypeptidase-like regulatory domain-containing protein [Aureibaculum sp. A20]|uniref:Carboxypeptidase-like regulatory domain-containing protein n=1 Tax=Aureibaculum flavum TaxID=2795986 RepID=A0ABS0WSK0_9FLAO|nr:carboxypeptidase-like regulatory domain-containing protein [Aureibaculum flavum]MBJ2174843.1 carboxypeptidase-like regulatory domain-containing protein [Aureibaculum flavum]
MLDYIIKVLLFQTLFLVVYDLFLKRETFFQWNRVYLMATSVLAYVIPLVKIDRVQQIIPQEYVVLLPEVVLNPSTVIKEQLGQPITLFFVLKVVFWIGVAVAGVLFALRLYKLVRLITANEKEFTSSYYLVWLQNNKAFSFFNYIFLGKESSNKRQIIEHELVHVQQKHSLDLLFFELQKILFWFNPYSYLYQARISELHEFIADSKAIKTEGKATYFNNLLSETFGVQNISFINPFFKHSLIKKRILMLNKNKSKQNLKFKYVLLIPVLAGMLLYTSCSQSTYSIEKDNNEISALDQIALRKSVPFAVIENAPIFPDCEDAEDPKECLKQSIEKFVAQKFNTNLTKGLGLDPGKKRVYVIFKIDKEGNVTDVKARGPHRALEDEALRVVSSLPKMIPGEHQGEKVGVKYTLPITLMVNVEEVSKHPETITLESQPKVLASTDNSIKNGIISGNVNGLVSGELKGLPGATVSIKGTNNATVTDFDGNFRIEADKGDILILDFKGLPSTEFKVTENNNYKVTM